MVEGKVISGQKDSMGEERRGVGRRVEEMEGLSGGEEVEEGGYHTHQFKRSVGYSTSIVHSWEREKHTHTPR